MIARRALSIPHPSSQPATRNPHPLNLRLLGVWLLLCAIWSTTWIFIKFGLEDLPPIWFAALRFILASGALLLFNLVRRAPLPCRAGEWAFIALTGVLTFAVNYTLLFWAEQRIPPGLAAVLQATIPAFGLVFAHWLVPGETFTLPKLAGIGLGVLGIGVIFAGELRLDNRAALWGSAAVVAGAASAAFANVLVKARGGHFDPAVLAWAQMTCGWVPLVALGWWQEGSPWHFHWTGRAVFSLGYLALLGSSLAFCLLYWLTRRVAVTRVMLISLVTPVAAILIDFLVLGIALPPRTLLGGLCVLLGLAVVVFRRAPSLPGRAGVPPASEGVLPE